MKINWIGLEKIGEERILLALSLAMKGKTVSEIAQATEIPKSSLYSIRKDGPYAHRGEQKSRTVSKNA